MKEKTKDVLFELGYWTILILVGGSFLWLTNAPNTHKPQVTAPTEQPTQGMNPIIKYHYFRKIGGFK